MRRLLLILGLIFLLPAWSPAPGQASSLRLDGPAGLTMSVQPAFGGRFKYGEWLPVFVSLENTGPDLSADIRVGITNQTGRLDFVAPAELPQGARKRFTLYTLPNNFSRSLEVKLVQGEEVLLQQKVNVTLVPNDRYVIGLAAAEMTGLMAGGPPKLPGRRERADTVGMDLEDIPERFEGLRLLNALVLNDIDTGRLTPAQQTALTHWVAGGGRLIIGGGAGAERTLAGLPPQLQPATLTGRLEVDDLPALAGYAGDPIRVPGPFLLAAAQPVEDARVLLSEPAATAPVPLVIERGVGAGHVDFVGLDLGQSPFDAWAGTPAFTNQLLSPDAAWPDYLPPDIAASQMSDSQITYALSNLPALDLPSIRLLGLLLVGYILLVGPANYLVLRRLDRLAWAWVTIPGLTLVFSGLAYGLSFSLRGSDVIVNQISIIQAGPDGQASQIRTYVGLFSPRRQAYDVAVSGQSLIRPLGEAYDPWSGSIKTGTQMSVVQGEPARVQGLAVNQWSMQSFVAETVPVEPPGLVGQLAPGRDSLRGQLTNRSSETWQDVIVVFNNQFQKLGDLAPGQLADIQIDFNQNPNVLISSSYMLYQDQINNSMGPDRDISFKQTVLDSTVFNNNPIRASGPFVLAWLKDSPLQVSLGESVPTSQKTSLLYSRLPVTFEGPRVGLPPGFSRIETLNTTGDAGACNYGPGINGYHLYQGVVEARIILPDTVQDVRPDHLDLYIRSDGGWSALPAIELLDRTSQKWTLMKDAKLGLNPIRELQRFYDPGSGSVAVRVSSENPAQGGGCLFFELAMEGERL